MDPVLVDVPQDSLLPAPPPSPADGVLLEEARSAVRSRPDPPPPDSAPPPDTPPPDAPDDADADDLRVPVPTRLAPPADPPSDVALLSAPEGPPSPSPPADVVRQPPQLVPVPRPPVPLGDLLSPPPAGPPATDRDAPVRRAAVAVPVDLLASDRVDLPSPPLLHARHPGPHPPVVPRVRVTRAVQDQTLLPQALLDRWTHPPSPAVLDGRVQPAVPTLDDALDLAAPRSVILDQDRAVVHDPPLLLRRRNQVLHLRVPKRVPGPPDAAPARPPPPATDELLQANVASAPLRAVVVQDRAEGAAVLAVQDAPEPDDALAGAERDLPLAPRAPAFAEPAVDHLEPAVVGAPEPDLPVPARYVLVQPAALVTAARLRTPVAVADRAPAGPPSAPPGARRLVSQG